MYSAKSEDTIGRLIIMTAKGDLEWEHINRRGVEILKTTYNITDNKYIRIVLRKKETNDNDIYSANFYYYTKKIDGKLLSSYFYTNGIFDLFIYAKYVNYIIINGVDRFIEVFGQLLDNYNWTIDNGVYTAVIEKKPNIKSTIEIGISFVNICIYSSYGKRVVYSIRDDSRLYKMVRSLH